MNSATEPLSHLVSQLGSSLAMYVADAGIWTFPGVEAIKLALADLADDHRSLIERAGAVLEERGAEVPHHPYPIQFTATHDLDLRALLPRIIAGLESQVTSLDRLVSSGGDAAGLELVREAVTSTRSHLNDLQQLLARPRAAAG